MGCCGSSERPNSKEKDKQQFQNDTLSNNLKQNSLSGGFKNKVEPIQKEDKPGTLPEGYYFISI